MKRLLIILSLLLVGASSFAQEGPAELTFKNTRIVDGASDEILFSRAEKWEKEMERKDHDIDHHINDKKSKLVEYFVVVKDCPNFGLSPFLGGDGTGMSLLVKIHARNGSYTAEISHIDVWYNPDLGILYGENEELYEDLYNRKQLKMGKEIVAFLVDYTDALFEEIYGFMSGN